MITLTYNCYHFLDILINTESKKRKRDSIIFTTNALPFHFVFLTLQKNKTPMPKFINPFSDWGFKKIFGQEINKDLLINFLNDLLEGERHIADLTFKDKEQLPELKSMRGIIYDIYCTTDNGEHFIVEMQNRYQPYFTDRSIFYTSRNIVNQGVKGMQEIEGGKRESWNYMLAPVYTICLMNYDIDVFTPTKFRTDVALMDMQENKIFSDRIRLIYLMLPLFEKNSEEECETDFERWIYILKNMNTFERMPFAARNAVFKKLSQIADIAALSEEDREKYDESMKVLLDYYATMEGAKIIGKREGKEQGIKEGRAEGRAEVAKNLLSMGLSVDNITKATGLNPEEIESLR